MNKQLSTSTGVREYGRKDRGQDDPDDIAKELKRVGDDIKKFAEDTQKEVKKSGDLSLESKVAVDALLVKHTDLAARMTDAEQKLARGGAGGAASRELVKSLGTQLVEADRFKEFVANKTRGTISVEVKAPMLSTDVSVGTPGVIMPQMLPGILPLLRRKLFIRDLISKGTTTAPSVAYVRMTGFVNGAAMVAEGTLKPSTTITFDTQIVHVSTLAHIFKAAKQLLDDFAALQSTIDDELRWGLALAEEQQILYGTGVGLNLHGIIPQAAAYVAAFVPTLPTPIDTIRLAILQSYLALIPPTGIVMHPMDWAKIELTKSTQGEYIWANPMQLGSATLWGLPVAESLAIVPNNFLTGAFQGGAQIFDREQANVVVATQNEDDFVKNLITIRAEERLALVVKRPEAFVTGTFGP